MYSSFMAQRPKKELLLETLVLAKSFSIVAVGSCSDGLKNTFSLRDQRVTRRRLGLEVDSS